MATADTKQPSKKAFDFPKSAADKPNGKSKKNKPEIAGENVASPEAEAKKTEAAAPARAKNGVARARKPLSAQTLAESVVVEVPHAAPAEPADTADAKVKRAKKEKVVRDSFTMPKSDYAKIASLKQKCAENGVRVKKSELLRAALAMLDAAPAKRIVAAVKALETVKTGRPSNA